MQLISVKYQSKRIGQLSEGDLFLHSNALIARIAIITGWVIPNDEFYLNTLISEFKQYLVENYSDLNPDEIAYAFRTYGTTVQDWGKSMNLSLIDEPLRKYLAARKCISDMEERKAAVPAGVIPMQTDWKELCESFYQQYLTGKYNIIFWPYEMYQEFVDCGWLAADVYEDFIEKAQTFLIGKQNNEITKEEIGLNRENILNTLQEELDKIVAGEAENVTRWAKRFAVQFLYYKANESGYKNLFVKA